MHHKLKLDVFESSSVRVDPRFARIAALCTCLLLLGWLVKSPTMPQFSHYTSESIPENQHKQMEYGAFTVTQFLQASEYASITASGGAVDSAPIPLPTKSLGWNGRPKLPFHIEAHRPEPTDDGSHLKGDGVQRYVDSINDLKNQNFWRMDCKGQHSPGGRYDVLRNIANEDPGIKYLFALDLYQSIDILPRLMSSIVRTIKHIGPQHCAISIIEGRSSDGTYLVLNELNKLFNELGIQYWLQQSDINPHGTGKDRIAELSKLRNMALDPLRTDIDNFSEHPLIFFVNDIAVCPDDLLEMLYQHILQDAVQTCSFDWVEGGNLFYDSWVSRSMTGNTFFEIPQDVSFAFSRNLFFDDPFAKNKYANMKPLQVFSCWGGMTVIDALPFINKQIEFRRNVDGECYGGEPQTLASDFAKLNISRVQVLPYVNVAYTNNEGAKTKKVHKHVQDHVDTGIRITKLEDDVDTERIKWRKPPPRIRCMPAFRDQWWVDSVFTPET